MSLVEDAYRAAIDRMTPAQKFHRTGELLSWGRFGVLKQIEREMGPLSPERMKWEILFRLYGKSPQLGELIKQELARVSA